MKTNSIHYGRYWVLYDSNALWNNYIQNFKIILINNGGGGIFRILPGHKELGFNTFFETSRLTNI
jgi:2-succinyl-5-enolpyruvyl-6-hydroxy-3-cyclohexene-1-carboxylate synthase